MSRPSVSVVMPFAGTPDEARASLAALDRLVLAPGDTVTLADNSGTAPSDDPRVVRADGERSPAHARNVGADRDHAAAWLLFLDADTVPNPDVVDAFLATPVAADVGAVGGEIDALPSGDSLAARFGASRNFLNSSTHLVHPYKPRLPAAILLVRRDAFDAVGGFREGIRAAEDTDFCWRLIDAGYRLDVRPAARAGHGYRSRLGDLRAQWRGYAAGRAWLGRTWPGFEPRPALHRALRRLRPGRATAAPGALPVARVNPGTPPRSRVERLQFLFVDVVLGIEELRGLRGSNDPG